MNKKEKRDIIVALEGNKTEEGRLKVKKIETLRDSSYNYKINTIFWSLFSGLEFLVRYIATDKSLKSLIPIGVIPLIGCLFNKIRLDRKVNNLQEEILNSKQK